MVRPRSWIVDNIKSWDTKLGQAEFAHNHATNRSTTFSPFHVVYGLVPRGPLDLTTTPEKTRHHGEAIDFINNLQDLHKLAQCHLDAATSKYRLAADAKRR